MLWGFVSYTKPPVIPESSQQGPEPTVSKASEARPISTEDSTARKAAVLVEVQHGIVAQKLAAEVFTRLRAKRQLRQLTVSEAGRAVVDVPPGTYFFVSDSDVAKGMFPKFGMTFFIKTTKALRFQATARHAEVHHPNNATRLLNVFTTEEAASRITQLSGTETRDFSATVFPWQGMTSLVSVPIDRVMGWTSRNVQMSAADEVTVLDFTVQ